MPSVMNQVDEEANAADNKDQLWILNRFWEGQSFNGDHVADSDDDEGKVC